jgi:hypothetical protein
VTEAMMPNIVRGGGRGERMGRRVLERIKLLCTIASKKLRPRKNALHRKTKRIKIYRTIIISSELVDGDKIFNYARGNNNIMEMKWTII